MAAPEAKGAVCQCFVGIAIHCADGAGRVQVRGVISRVDRIGASPVLKLHGFAVSNYFNMVKLALLEKGLPFEVVQV